MYENLIVKIDINKTTVIQIQINTILNIFFNIFLLRYKHIGFRVHAVLCYNLKSL